MRVKLQKIGLFILLLMSILALSAGCQGTEELKDENSNQSTNDYIPPASEDGYVIVTIPTSLMGGQTPSEHIADYRNDELYEAAGAVPMTKRITDVTANEDGSVNYIFTPEQFWNYKQALYEMGRIKLGYGGDFPSSIVEACYADVDENGIPWSVVVTVNKDDFNEDYINSMFFSTIWPANYLGQYQLFCGVKGNEWSVHIIVKDAKSDEVILETDFPTQTGAGE